jgi:serine/alanine adding enzyme
MKPLPDIYFRPEYGRLYERHENGTLESFSYKTAAGEVYFQFIRRPLDAFDGFDGYSDIVTPYGYGGPVFLGGAKKTRPALAFQEYCRDTKTVSAFVRFHPLLGNGPEFASAFDEVVPIRKTVAIDLSKDLYNEEFNYAVRKNCRKAKGYGLSIQYDTALDTMDSFVRLYYQLMDMKKTVDYYYFPESYFDGLKSIGSAVELVNAVLDGEIVASILYLKYGDFIHTHLSGTTTKGYQTRAAEYITSNRALIAKDEGYKWCHLGGGFSNEPDDSLYLFKRKFSNSAPLDFYVGKSVYAPKAYEALCRQAAGRQHLDESYFPKYRAIV